MDTANPLHFPSQSIPYFSVSAIISACSHCCQWLWEKRPAIRGQPCPKLLAAVPATSLRRCQGRTPARTQKRERHFATPLSTALRLSYPGFSPTDSLFSIGFKMQIGHCMDFFSSPTVFFNFYISGLFI